MNDLSNPALTSEPDYLPTQGAFPVWSKVFTKPGEKTFLEITSHPEAKAKTAFLWVFLAGTLSGLINSLMQLIATLAGLKQIAPQLGQLSFSPAAFGIGGLLGAICGAPIAGLLSVIGFAIGVTIIHATARFFGGQGSFDKLAYSFGAIAVPFSLVSALMVPLNLIPFLVFCTLPALLILALYVLFLQVTAVKAMHGFGWLEAVAALILPVILIGLLCGFVFLGFIKLAGPSINDIFQQLRQGAQ
jgi:hypothetical protein